MDDVVAVWSVEQAREAAWKRAEVLAALAAEPELVKAYVATNDRTTGFAGRALLVPVGLE